MRFHTFSYVKDGAFQSQSTTLSSAMKLFLWNDRNWKIVDENTDYDTEDYVIARNIFVRWFPHQLPGLINEQIHEVFKQFGEIESVQRSNEDDVFDGTYKAIVTFTHSESAYNVLVAHHNGSFISEHLISVMPADTCHQINVQPTESEQMDTCDESDDEPHIKDVTNDFRELSLHQMDHGCNNIDNILEIDLSLGLNLKQIRSRIFEAKSYQNHLILSFYIESDDSDSDEDIPLFRLDKLEFEKRVLQTVAKIGAKRFRKLTICGKDQISIEFLQLLKPLLMRLKILNIETYSNSQILHALPKFCMNVSKVQFCGFKWRGNIIQTIDVKAWPTLTQLVLKYVELDIRSETENGQQFQRFIELNPQLQVLDLEPIADAALFNCISSNLKNLRSLTVTRPDCSDTANIADSLSRLKYLSTVMITTLVVKQGELHLISMCTERFHAFELVILIQNYETDEEEDFERLADFPAIYHNGCLCDSDNERSVSFGEYLDEVAIPKEQPALVLIVNTPNPNKSIDATHHDDTIDMFEDSKKFYPNAIELQVLKEEDHFTYVHVSSA
ncbi:uncharacterized protein LOC116338072 [Contarinia nasturtii]|uniref:uncharacterized protein LOC116338072 n=1 Tax=Contarinia nasturtii TaxID=265458 RepID=UPI0012D3AFFD|nr:uncharacterized protein LOC116338072 [Contarinia nasturtii]